MKLYYSARTRAFTSLWMMEEVGQPYEIERVDIRAPGHPTDAYKRINPMGKLAGFQDGECAMGETAAILLYVADKFPQTGLAPAQSVMNHSAKRYLPWLLRRTSRTQGAEEYGGLFAGRCGGRSPKGGSSPISYEKYRKRPPP